MRSETNPCGDFWGSCYPKFLFGSAATTSEGDATAASLACSGVNGWRFLLKLQAPSKVKTGRPTQETLPFGFKGQGCLASKHCRGAQHLSNAPKILPPHPFACTNAMSAASSSPHSEACGKKGFQFGCSTATTVLFLLVYFFFFLVLLFFTYTEGTKRGWVH